MNVTESALTLKYSLHVPAVAKESITADASEEDIAKWLDSAYARAKSTECNPFIGNKRYTYFCPIGATKQADCVDYAALSIDNNFWEHVFKQEAILTAYTISRKLISDYSDLPVSKIIPALMPHGPSGTYNESTSIYGLSYLLSHKNKHGELLATLTSNCEISFFNKPRLSISNNMHISKKYPFVPSALERCNDKLKKRVKKIAAEQKMGAEEFYKSMDNKTKLDTLEEMLYDIHKQSKLVFHKNRATSTIKTTSKVINIDNISTKGVPKYDYRNLLNLHNLEMYQLMSRTAKRNTTILNSILKPQFANPEKRALSYDSFSHKKMVSEYLKLKHNLELPGLLHENYKQAPDVKNLNEHKEVFDTKNPKEHQETPAVFLDLADKVYARYKIEQTYSVEFIDSLYTIIADSPLSDVLRNQIDLIAECCLLPNVFTRQILLQVLTDNLHYKNIRTSDFGDSPVRTVLTHDKAADSQTEYEKLAYWKKSYLDLIHSLKNYIFPIFNSCFFTTIWNDIRCTTITDEECAERLFRFLTKYLNCKEQVAELLSVTKFYPNAKPEIMKKYPSGPITPFNPSTCDGSKIDLKLYTKCADAVASKRREIKNPPVLIDSEYIENLFIENNDHPQKAFYRVAKNHI